MKLRETITIIAIAFVLAQGCSPAGGNKRGHEFMPDMVHSTAYEANIYDYYYYNTWGTEEEYKEFVNPRDPVAGTIPRGYAGLTSAASHTDIDEEMKHMTGRASHSGISIPINGHVPYYYENTEEERARAQAEININPFPISKKGLERGNELYDIYCGICHGEKGDGLGYLVREADPIQGITAGVYPVAPANMQQDTFYKSSNGRYYHAIMYGKNLMSGYADKLSFEERWQVIHYIRSLQAKEQGLIYNEEENTFTDDIPMAAMGMHMEDETEESGPAGGEEADDSEAHGDEPGHDDGH
jgi:mono/diheme cytochrome c family protein